MDAYASVKSAISQRNFSPIYFLMGDEPFFIDDISRLLIDTVLPEEQRDFNQTILYGKDTSVDEIVSVCKRFPMMADYQLVVVREAHDLSRSIEQLTAYTEQPQPTTILVICFKNKKLDKRKKLSKAIQKNGIIVETKKLYDNKLPSWIEQRVRAMKRNIDYKAVAVLAESVGADLGALSNQLEKLCLIVSEGDTISSDHVEQHVGISKEYNNFELRKALGSGNVAQAFKIAHYFGRHPKQHPLLGTINSLYKFFMQLLTYHGLPSKNPDAAAKALGVHPFFIKEIEQAARRYPLKSIVPILRMIKTSDLAAKGVDAVPISEGEALRQLIAKLT
ncbi:MAG: DNA polymerase III subunit delta [Flavobacteriaceae bacterium]